MASTTTSTTTITYTDEGFTLTGEWEVVELPEYRNLRGRKKKKKKHHKSTGPPPLWLLEDIFAGGLQFFNLLGIHRPQAHRHRTLRPSST